MPNTQTASHPPNNHTQHAKNAYETTGQSPGSTDKQSGDASAGLEGETKKQDDKPSKKLHDPWRVYTLEDALTGEENA